MFQHRHFNHNVSSSLFSFRIIRIGESFQLPRLANSNRDDVRIHKIGRGLKENAAENEMPDDERMETWNNE